MYEMPLGWEKESDRFIAGAGWNWKSGGYWRQEWDDIGGSVGRSRAIRTRRNGRGGVIGADGNDQDTAASP